MTNSAQNPDPPSGAGPQPAVKRIIRKAAAPPGSAPPPDPNTGDLFVHGDETDRFFHLRAQAHQCASDPAAFLGIFADYLATEAMCFERSARGRAVAACLQISEDYEDLSAKYENIDDNARQYIAFHKLFSDPAFRAFMGDLDRSFRRAAQSHKTLLQAARRVNR